MKNKFLLLIILPIVALGITVYGFVSGDPILKTYTPTESGSVATYGPALDHSVQAINESFESPTFPPAGWVKFSPLGREGWTRQLIGTTPVPGFNGGTVTGPVGGGTAVANVTYTTPAAQNSEWLITPQITNVQPGDSLTYWLRFWPTQYPDSFNVKISTTTQTVAAMTTVLSAKRYTGDADSGWKQVRVAIGNTVPAGSNIYLGFQESFFDGSSFTLDLISYIPAAAPPAPLSWFEQTTPVAGQLASVSAASDNAVWAVGYTSNTSGPPLVVRTTNGGTWTNALGTGIGATVPLFNVWGIDENTALITGSNATGAFVYRTSNGGSTWTTVFTQPGGFMNAIVMSDANNGFMTGDPNPAAGGRWSLFKTTNGGVNWDSTGRYLPQTGSEAGWNNGAAIVGTNIWFATNNTKVYYSSNNGANWTGQATGEAGASGAVVWFNNATNGFYGGATLKMTTNGGGAWTANAGSGTGSFGGITGLGTNWWTIRGTTAVGTSTNDGSTWSTAYTSPSGNYIHIAKSRTPGSSLLWVTKSNGQVSKYGVTTGVNPVGGQLVDSYSLNQNYPNPFNPSTSISFAIPQNGFVSLKVYNMLGKEVATLVNGNLNSGAHNYSFNASNLASGIYFYKLETGSFVETKKMMLVK